MHPVSGTRQCPFLWSEIFFSFSYIVEFSGAVSPSIAHGSVRGAKFTCTYPAPDAFVPLCALTGGDVTVTRLLSYSSANSGARSIGVTLTLLGSIVAL